MPTPKPKDTEMPANEWGKLRSYMAGMSAKVDEYFLIKPKAPYDVRRLAPELEGAMTFGFYQPPSKSEPTGIYFYNGSNPSEKSLLWAAGLLYHELVPGHHFHIASQYELA